jgi:hypothetical protein
LYKENIAVPFSNYILIIQNFSSNSVMIKKLKKVQLLPDQTIVAFDHDGNPIHELQGKYSVTLHKRVLFESTSDTIIEGFEIIPEEHHEWLNGWANFYKQLNMKWEEINNL